MSRANQQIYESNSSIKYPFVDTHTENVPDDLVLDMSLSVPANIVPVATVISVTETYFFMGIEDSTTGTAIGHVMVTRPALGRIYEITTTMEYAFGWVVLGPGRNRVFENRALDLGFDKGIILLKPQLADSFTDMTIDGFTYEDLQGALTITANNPYIKLTLEDRGSLGLCLVMSRDDSQVPVSVVYGGLTVQNRNESIYGTPATSIGGVRPDTNYNVDITSSDVTITTMDPAIGLVLYMDADVCNEFDPRTRFTHGRCDEGINVPLPLDPIVEELKPQYLEDDCGCED